METCRLSWALIHWQTFWSFSSTLISALISVPLCLPLRLLFHIPSFPFSFSLLHSSLFSFFLLSSPIVLLSLLLLLHPADPELQAHVYLQVGLLGPLITGARARWAPSSLRTTDAGAGVWEGLSPSGRGGGQFTRIASGSDQALCKYHYEAVISLLVLKFFRIVIIIWNSFLVDLSFERWF